MFLIRNFIFLILLVTNSISAWAARELVDDFNDATINFSKWSEYDPSFGITEYLVRINTDDENLVLINAGDGVGPYREGYRRQGSRTWMANPDLSALQATISIVSVDDGDSKAAANIEGTYYNAYYPLGPINQIGEVFAMVSIGDRGSGLEAWWEIHESTHPEFETWNETSGTIIPPGTLALNTPYVSSIEYDGNQTFNFAVDSVNSGPVSGPARTEAPFLTRQHLSTSTRCCGTNPSIHATFDDVYKGNPLVLVDDFSSGPHLDRSIWGHYGGSYLLSSRVDPSITGKLFMSVSDENIQQNGRSSTDLYLRERNPDRFEARVSISSDSVLEPGLLGRARLNGYAYNERRDGGNRR